MNKITKWLDADLNRQITISATHQGYGVKLYRKSEGQYSWTHYYYGDNPKDAFDAAVDIDGGGE